MCVCVLCVYVYVYKSRGEQSTTTKSPNGRQQQQEPPDFFGGVANKKNRMGKSSPTKPHLPLPNRLSPDEAASSPKVPAKTYKLMVAASHHYQQQCREKAGVGAENESHKWRAAQARSIPFSQQQTLWKAKVEVLPIYSLRLRLKLWHRTREPIPSPVELNGSPGKPLGSPFLLTKAPYLLNTVVGKPFCFVLYVFILLKMFVMYLDMLLGAVVPSSSYHWVRYWLLPVNSRVCPHTRASSRGCKIQCENILLWEVTGESIADKVQMHLKLFMSLFTRW